MKHIVSLSGGICPRCQGRGVVLQLRMSWAGLEPNPPAEQVRRDLVGMRCPGCGGSGVWAVLS